MGKDPAMPFYVNDWLSSGNVTCMSLEQQGAFLRLLCHCWASQDASLPDDDEQLAALSGMGQGWLDGGSRLVRKCLTPHPTKSGHLTNERTHQLWVERLAWKEKSSEGGRNSAAAKKKRRGNGGSNLVSTKPQPNVNSPSSSYSPSSPSPIAPTPAKALGPLSDTCLAEWAEAEAALIAAGLGTAPAVVAGCLDRGCQPVDVRRVLAHWRDKAPAWGAGGLAHRLGCLLHNQDPADPNLWPPPSAAAQAVQRNGERAAVAAKFDAQRAADAKQAEVDRLESERLEHEHGAEVNALKRDEIRAIIAAKYPADNGKLMLSRLPAKGKPTGLLRHDLLSHFDSHRVTA